MYQRLKSTTTNKNLKTPSIHEATRLAKADGAENDHEIALWAIDNSPHWRSKGYTEILDALREAKQTPQ
jgi:hypothetical protein